MAAIRRPDVFRCAVVGAPVITWENYDTHYTERYLGLPAEAPEAYRVSNVTTYAAEASRPLLLVHGLTDDNVYFQHTLQLADALFRAGKSYELLPMLGTHMAGSSDPVVRLREQQRVMEFAQLISQTDVALFRSKVGTYLDVDEFLRFVAVNAFIENWDSYIGGSHNYYFYLDPSDDKFRFLPWDEDLAMGARGGMGGRNFTMAVPYSGNQPLIYWLLDDPADPVELTRSGLTARFDAHDHPVHAAPVVAMRSPRGVQVQRTEQRLRRLALVLDDQQLHVGPSTPENAIVTRM